MPSRNGPTRSREPTPSRAEHDQRQREQRDSEVRHPVARLDVVEHDRPQHVERADHQEHRRSESDGAGERPDPQQVERESLLGRLDGLVHVHTRHERQGDRGGHGDDEERGRDAERPDEHSRHRRSEREPTDVGREQPAEVLAEPLGLGQDHDASDRWRRHADPDTHHQAPDEERHERGRQRHHHQTDAVQADTEQHQLSGMPAVGAWRDQDLREEAGEEADSDDGAEQGLTDAVLVAVVVEHREQHAVAGTHRARDQAERDDQREASHTAARYQHPAWLPPRDTPRVARPTATHQSRIGSASMCGRFVSSSSPEKIAAYFDAASDVDKLGENYNVAPTNDIYAVVAGPDGKPQLQVFHWGLIPVWAKERKIGSKMINARAETLGSKPAYKGVFKKHRCIIPMDGFYEWAAGTPDGPLTKQGKPAKQPMFIHRLDGEPLAVAGLWSAWRDPADASDAPWLHSATVVTTAANGTMEPIHDRMPVILPASAWAEWLDPDNEDITALSKLLIPAPDTLLTMHKVSTDVNNVRNKGPHLTDPPPDEA